MPVFAVNICGKCERIDYIPFTQEDIDYAKQNGGLFTKIMDHGDHLIKVKIDPDGHVRRETILSK